jgi:hypothetical protein
MILDPSKEFSMRLFSWFRSRRAARRHRRQRQTRLQLELLEGREVPACNTTATGIPLAPAASQGDRGRADNVAPGVQVSDGLTGKLAPDFDWDKWELENQPRRYSRDRQGRYYKNLRGLYLIDENGYVSAGFRGICLMILIPPPLRDGNWDPTKFRSEADIPSDPPINSAKPLDPIEFTGVWAAPSRGAREYDALALPACPEAAVSPNG